MQDPQAIGQAAVQAAPSIMMVFLAVAVFLFIAALSIGLAFAGWLVIRILIRNAYPPEPKACPHCGKPIP